jgi:hypothetical protein
VQDKSTGAWVRLSHCLHIHAARCCTSTLPIDVKPAAVRSRVCMYTLLSQSPM